MVRSIVEFLEFWGIFGIFGLFVVFGIFGIFEVFSEFLEFLVFGLFVIFVIFGVFGISGIFGIFGTLEFLEYLVMEFPKSKTMVLGVLEFLKFWNLVFLFVRLPKRRTNSPYDSFPAGPVAAGCSHREAFLKGFYACAKFLHKIMPF